MQSMSKKLAVAAALGLVWALPVLGAPAKPAAKPAPKPAPKPADNTIKGQNQLAGANGQFGAVYSLKGDFNVSILGASYSIEPFVAYAGLQAGTDSKLFLVDLAIKNVSAMDNFFGAESFITLVDSTGQLYRDGSIGLRSQGIKDFDFTLRPGQGRGQVDTNDPLQMAFLIPEKARIVKIMINKGRIGKDEEVVRYYLAGATKAEAGEAGDPKNVVKPLPQAVRDPSDPTGNTPIAIGKAKMDEFVTSGAFALRLDDFAYTDKPVLPDQEIEEGHRLAVATITARALTPREIFFVDFIGGDTPLIEITDADGEKVRPLAIVRAKTGEGVDKVFKMAGEEYTFRAVFQVKKDQAAKSLMFGAGESRRYSADVSAVK
jgi:hypothetical protein